MAKENNPYIVDRPECDGFTDGSQVVDAYWEYNQGTGSIYIHIIFIGGAKTVFKAPSKKDAVNFINKLRVARRLALLVTHKQV